MFRSTPFPSMREVLLYWLARRRRNVNILLLMEMRDEDSVA